MAEPLVQIEAIRQAIGVIVDHGPPAVWPVARGLMLWLDQAEALVTIDDALELPRRWRSEARRRQRDMALIELRARHFPALWGREAARAVGAAVRRYQTTSWPRDKCAGRRPDGLHGLSFDLLSVAELPGEEVLRRLFARVFHEASKYPAAAG